MSGTLSTQLVTIDYDYIKNNYLNQKVWGKEWNIYNYSGMSVVLSLASIQISSGYASVKVSVTVTDDLFIGGFISDFDWLPVPLFRDDYTNEMFRIAIFNLVTRLLSNMEVKALQNMPLYDKVDEYETNRIDELKELATSYMHSLNVYNNTIVSAYADNFVFKNFIGFLYKLDYDYTYSKGRFLNKHYQLFASFSDVECPKSIKELTGSNYDDFLAIVDAQFEEYKKKDMAINYSDYLKPLDEEE